jgi:hypothetical protein
LADAPGFEYAHFQLGRRRPIVPQFGFVSGSFWSKTTLPERYFGTFLPFFASFLQNEPNSLFFSTCSFQNTSTFFSWVRLVKNTLF